MRNNTGLREVDFEIISSVLNLFPSISEAFLFGNRAKGNFRSGSDVDIALKGEDLNFGQLAEVSRLLNDETILPYKFDVLNYHTITNPELIDHIDRVGICFYKRV